MKIAMLVLCCAMCASVVSAEPPRLVNAKVASKAATPDVARVVASIVAQQEEPAWVGYAVPILNRSTDGWQDGWSERCRLEQTQGNDVANPVAAGPIKLEPSPTVVVLVRLQNRQVQRIRTLSSDCAIDGGGLPFYWLEPVDAAQSVAFLKSFVGAAGSRQLEDGSISAIALHQDRSAATVLLDLAQNNPNARIRQRALVAVARRAESQAGAIITNAIDRDPDTEVKKQAVFALSQLPKDEGIPLLIRIARTNTNPAVRKQAMFWLGQSRDPRAVAYFEEVLR